MTRTVQRLLTPVQRPKQPDFSLRRGRFLGLPLPKSKFPSYNSQVEGSCFRFQTRVLMTISRQPDFLEPINLADHLGKVELYLGQVCQIAGISKMQLDYWTNKAQIPTKGKKQRIYDIDALETVMLDRKSTRLNSSHSSISYAVFCLKKKKKT